ncbi:MAG: DUF421 domain-containing protein [Nibricoccus sp.]
MRHKRVILHKHFLVPELYQQIQAWMGLHTKPEQLTLLQMSLRAVVLFFAALVMLRLAHKRFFARRNTIDVLLTFVIASTLSRAINGSAAYFPTIGLGFILVFLHRLFTWLCKRFSGFEQLVKGSASVLITDGQVDHRMLQRHDLTIEDLREDVRLKGTEDVSQVASACLERNGEISVSRKQT